jgi:hypothetical protein
MAMNTLRTLFNKTFAAAALLQFSLSSGSAQAALLQGHIEQVTAGNTASMTSQVQQGGVAIQSFPKTYEGIWHCVTTVTDSAVPDVAPGTVTQCNIEFKRNLQGQVGARWAEAGWTEGQSTVVSFNETEARLDRTAYYLADGTSPSWAARSRETFKLTDRQDMTSSSYVDQYVDGQYVGRYRTTSVLHRDSAPNATAMLPGQ